MLLFHYHKPWYLNDNVRYFKEYYGITIVEVTKLEEKAEEGSTEAVRFIG